MKPLYLIMPDGTVKQINPFTESEVWSVPGRNNKPITNEVPETAKPLEVHHPEDYCSFCQKEKEKMNKVKSKIFKAFTFVAPFYFELLTTYLFKNSHKVTSENFLHILN
ncbi:DUF4921 family protein [Candidatus Kryptonium thompsonii]|uniref:DUF4921 family protein n=1 Tax=Candidatus Kryptonium thompsonii TaxID=1633631 RepID=UPI000707FC27|nr:DUF4921 family protein [Candidatus Kryptonium thompsoni]CUS94049.1 protein of unknown function (DUF4921) [Candidatus Kryptonium thompsoni]